MNGPDFKIKVHDIRGPNNPDSIAKGRPLSIEATEGDRAYWLYHCGRVVGLLDAQIEIPTPALWWVETGSEWTESGAMQDVTFRAYPFEACGCVTNFGGSPIRWCQIHEPGDGPVTNCDHGYPVGTCSQCEQAAMERDREAEQEYRSMTRSDY